MTLIRITKMFRIPSREKPVSSAHIPNVPPKLAILSDRVVLESRTVISTFGDLNFIRMITIFFDKVCTF